MQHSLIQKALAEIAKTGPVTPSRVVAAAADPNNPLHGQFPWDDAKAAHEYRLIVARKLIVSVRFTPAGSDRSVPIYVHVPAKMGEGEYLPVNVIARQPAAWQLARDEVLKKLDAARDNLDDLNEILRVYGPPRPEVGRASRSIGRARKEVASISAG